VRKWGREEKRVADWLRSSSADDLSFNLECFEKRDYKLNDLHFNKITLFAVLKAE
jgi:hypothetical protein